MRADGYLAEIQSSSPGGSGGMVGHHGSWVGGIDSGITALLDPRHSTETWCLLTSPYPTKNVASSEVPTYVFYIFSEILDCGGGGGGGAC